MIKNKIKKKDNSSNFMSDLFQESLSLIKEKPKCEYFGICGGCTIQDINFESQVSIKQIYLEKDLKDLFQLKPELIERPIFGSVWGYRHKARLSVRFVKKKSKLLIGFRERKSGFVTDMDSCLVLPTFFSRLLMPLRDLINNLSIRDLIPQIELAIGEKRNESEIALILRVYKLPNNSDLSLLNEFSNKWKLQFWIQPKGPQSIYPLDQNKNNLKYFLPEYDLTIFFKPFDFTQINHKINRTLVNLVVRLLDLKCNDKVLDLFCGIGNFSLPIAKKAKKVIGVEGNKQLLERATLNANFNALENKVKFIQKDLFNISLDEILKLGILGKIVVDPPRDGALQLCKILLHIKKSKQKRLPKLIVYVSCNKMTFMRDVDFIVNKCKYVFSSLRILNMFPHTNHCELVGLFTRSKEN